MKRFTSGTEGASDRRVFRATSGIVVLIAAVIVSIFLLGDAVWRAGWGEMLLVAPWLLLVLWLIYVLMFAPAVMTDAAGVTVVNYLRRTRVPWQRVTDVQMRYQVIFSINGGGGDSGRTRLLKAYGGPVAGRPGLPRPTRAGLEGSRLPPALRDVGLIREQWESALDNGTSSGVLRRSWDLPALGALIVLIAWAVGAVLITRGVF